MSYLSASKLTFSPKWADMSDDEQLAEQVAALDIVAKYGGDIKAQYVLWSGQLPAQRHRLSGGDLSAEGRAGHSALRRPSCAVAAAPFRSRTSCRGRTKCGRSREVADDRSGRPGRDGALPSQLPRQS